uniref:Uncharacterized protein n=1 Tax=Arundo donax TaxID=35708 RepID=A0A0A8ZEF1_ARUDO
MACGWLEASVVTECCVHRIM